MTKGQFLKIIDIERRTGKRYNPEIYTADSFISKFESRPEKSFTEMYPLFRGKHKKKDKHAHYED